MDSAQSCDLAPIFGDLSHSEKLSEIKQPLVCKILGSAFLGKQNFIHAIKACLKRKS